MDTRRFDYPIQKSEKPINIETRLPEFDEHGNSIDWVVWAYLGLIKNVEAESQTNVRVAFRRLLDKEVAEEVLSDLPISALNIMPIGSIWRGNRSDSQVTFSYEELKVDYSTDQWCFNSFESAKRTGGKPPWHRRQEAILPSTDAIIYLQLKLSENGWLIIPALEYFVRMYGVSNALRQTLLTRPWVPEGAPTDRLYAPIKRQPQPGNWAVRLRRTLHAGDEIFLAHAKYEKFSTDAAKQPYAQLEAMHNQYGSDYPISIEVGPWHQQQSTLAVEGVWFDSEQSFLALRIVGSEDPKGPKIEIDRDNSNLFKKSADDKRRGGAWANIPATKGRKKSTLTGHYEPDRGADNEIVAEPKLFRIGVSRETERVIGEEVLSPTLYQQAFFFPSCSTRGLLCRIETDVRNKVGEDFTGLAITRC